LYLRQWIMKKTVSLIIALIFLTSFSSAIAEIKTFIKEYTYQASELDSKSTSRTMALEQVKRLLLEELGVFLVSKTDVVNFALTKDQITSITAGIVSAEILDERWDGHNYWLKAKIDADPYVVQQAIEVIRNDTKKTSELDAAQKRIEALTKDLEAVKSDLGSTPQERQKRYTKIVNQKQSMDWMLKFINTFNDKKSFAENKEALDAVNNAIEIDPEYSDPYMMRAYMYGEIAKDNQKAIEDMTKAIKYLVPGPTGPKRIFENAAGHYEYRGLLYKRIGKFTESINDLMTALELDPRQILKPLAQWKASDLDDFVKKYPKDYRVYVFRGRFNSHFISQPDNPNTERIKVYDQAIVDLKKALKMNSKNPVVYYVLIDAYRYKARDYDIRHMDKVDPVNHQNIVDNATRGLRLNVGEVWKDRFLHTRAEEYLTLKKYKLAIADYNALISLNPDYAGTYHDRAIAHKELGEYDDAVRDLTKAIGMKHDAMDWPRSAYEIRAHVYEAMEKYEDAVNDYSKALEVWEKVFGELHKEGFGSSIAYDILDRRAKDHRKLKQYPKAIDDYNTAISWVGKDFTYMVYANLGDTYIEMEKPAEAIKEYDKAIEVWLKSYMSEGDRKNKTDILSSEYFLKKAGAYANLKEYDLAIESYNNAIDAVDDFPAFKGKIYQEMGMLYRSLGINQEAIKVLSLAVKYLPLAGENPIVSYLELESAYSDIGDNKDSLRVCSEMIMFYPNADLVYLRRGYRYYETKDYNRAIIDYNKAIELKPTNGFAHYFRALTYIRLDQHKKAIEDLRIAARLGHKEAQNMLKDNNLDWK
jgi:tetratricopeptide (TPR) repeat protein